MIAYFDESGKPDDMKIATLAAVVALDLKWFKFDVKWRDILRREKAAIHPTVGVRWLHLTDFPKREPPYNDWSEAKRIDFCKQIAETTKDAIIFGTVHSLVVKDWNEVVAPGFANSYKRKRGWYIFLMQGALIDIATFVKLPRHERIAWVFDENKEVSYAAECHYNGLREARRWDNLFGAYTVDRSALVPGLQCADMLAFEGRRRVEEKVIHQSTEPIRKLLENLIDRKQITIGRYTREDLTKFHGEWMQVRAYREAMQQDNGEES